MELVRLFRGKLLAIALVCVTVVAGVTVVFAATPVGPGLVHSITGSTHATVTPDVDSHENTTHANDHRDNKRNNSICPGLPDAQHLATQFSLSTDSKSDDIQAICSLHQGTFKGTTPTGTTVSSNQVFGYGEVDELLTYTQYLAGRDKANAGGKLTSANVRSYLAEAIMSCGTTPLDTCLKTNIPGFQPGNGHDGGHGNGNGHGKSSSTPAPHH